MPRPVRGALIQATLSESAINRPGFEEPWRIGEFYGQSYFCDPRGQFIAVAGRDHDEIVIADMDFDLNREVRNTWQFFRNRLPESYSSIVALSPIPV